MAAPTVPFTNIPPGDFASGKAGLTTTGIQLRDNDAHLQEWLGGSYVAAVDHDHDGVNSKAIKGVDVQVFTASGAWNKPAGAVRVLVEMWGGGGGGGGVSTWPAAAGGGGAYRFHAFRASDLLSSEPVVVGAGGVGAAGAGNGASGGNSSFAGIIAYGGQFGAVGDGTAKGGAGGGWGGIGLYQYPHVGARQAVESTTRGNNAFYGGASGASHGSNSLSAVGGNAEYGGGGGGSRLGAGGISKYGGNGGAGGNPPFDGSIPGGGGGGGNGGPGSGGGDGARGEVRVTTWISS